tara:strand:+ start:70 stop:456 length:387 start_codon:yes stop_codon:yes gene_type:complete
MGLHNLSKLKTVHITGLEYQDKVNGNSYFALEILLNQDASNQPQMSIKIPLQYGYEEQYLYEANKRIRSEFRMSKWYKEKWNLFHAEDHYKFKLEYHKIKNCTKKRINDWYNNNETFYEKVSARDYFI